MRLRLTRLFPWAATTLLFLSTPAVPQTTSCVTDWAISIGTVTAEHDAFYRGAITLPFREYEIRDRLVEGQTYEGFLRIHATLDNLEDPRALHLATANIVRYGETIDIETVGDGLEYEDVGSPNYGHRRPPLHLAVWFDQLNSGKTILTGVTLEPGVRPPPSRPRATNANYVFLTDVTEVSPSLNCREG